MAQKMLSEKRRKKSDLGKKKRRKDSTSFIGGWGQKMHLGSSHVQKKAENSVEESIPKEGKRTELDISIKEKGTRRFKN